MRTLYREIMGTSPESRVLEVFLEWDGLLIVMEDLKDETEVNTKRLETILKIFLNKNIIGRTEKGYFLNRKDKLAKSFRNSFSLILRKN